MPHAAGASIRKQEQAAAHRKTPSGCDGEPINLARRVHAIIEHKFRFPLLRLTASDAGVLRRTYTADSMTRFDVDLFVIGGGSGGVRAARVAAEHGARVAIAEADRWGGTCVIRGCVPKKLIVYASEVSRSLDDARGQGWTIPRGDVRWASLIAAKDKEIARLSAAYAERACSKAGVRVIEGRARLADPHTIEVGRRAHHRREHPRSRPAARRSVPPTGRWITSDEAFHLPALPEADRDPRRRLHRRSSSRTSSPASASR